MSEYETYYPIRREKNALKYTIKAISLIDIELRILQWQLQYNRKERILEEENAKTNIHWTGTAADLVEFAYGALETKKFENGDIDINLLVKKLCKLFSFEVKDCYDTFRAIRRRVGSRTLFLDEMIEKLNERMDNMDNGIFKKKKIRRKDK
ncbi:MAG: RteC domain-containing protein [Dysgonomonas mossii]|uniref:RteC domain-containing protein n=1 Tax=Dysgonomonas mossii TaxID=163665 RepID=UPI003996C91B